MSRVLVIGYGNPLRGDDAVGWRVAEALTRDALPEGVEVMACHQLTPELAERLAAADLAVFVDAAAGDRPGAIATRAIDAVEAAPLPFSHQCAPAELLAWARAVCGHYPAAVVVSVTAAQFDMGAQLSPVVGDRLATVVCHVRHLAGIDAAV
jgi:hydrogenase maturation protease